MTQKENFRRMLEGRSPEFIPVYYDLYKTCSLADSNINHPSNGGRDAFGVEWVRTAAVSYTHLDVYKRQVYDCASNHAMEMCGFPATLLSGGEVSIAMNGVIDYGFTGLTDLEWAVSRIATTSSVPLICDIEDGFGGPLAVYRSAKRLSAAGAAAIQLEDSRCV